MQTFNTVEEMRAQLERVVERSLARLNPQERAELEAKMARLRKPQKEARA